jgi:uncharacterized surface protein with fasciclin (FAS1) repeats
MALVFGVSVLRSNAEGDSCPLKAAAAKDGKTCGVGAKTASAEGTCADKAAKTASAESCPAAAGACESKTTATTVADKSGECCEETAAAKLAADTGESCPASGCESKQDLVKLVMNDQSFATLILAAKAADMMAAFECPQPKTLFAPTNEAFQKLSAEQWASLLQDTGKLKAVLGMHIVPGAIPAEQLQTVKTAKTSTGAEVAVSACCASGAVSVGNAKVVKSDLLASNGIVHVIDSVLLPADMLEVTAAQPREEAPVQVASN